MKLKIKIPEDGDIPEEVLSFLRKISDESGVPLDKVKKFSAEKF